MRRRTVTICGTPEWLPLSWCSHAAKDVDPLLSPYDKPATLYVTLRTPLFVTTCADQNFFGELFDDTVCQHICEDANVIFHHGPYFGLGGKILSIDRIYLLDSERICD